MIVCIGGERAAIDASRSRRKQAEVGFESEDHRIRTSIAMSSRSWWSQRDLLLLLLKPYLRHCIYVSFSVIKQLFNAFSHIAFTLKIVNDRDYLWLSVCVNGGYEYIILSANYVSWACLALCLWLTVFFLNYLSVNGLERKDNGFGFFI